MTIVLDTEAITHAQLLLKTKLQQSESLARMESVVIKLIVAQTTCAMSSATTQRQFVVMMCQGQ